MSVLTAFKDVSRIGDRSAFDVKTRATALGTDPGAAFAFVRNEIWNELYPGVLRGAAGTLSAGAGNDLDRSLLLGALLAEAKHRVRYAHCTLSNGQAEQRVAALFTDRTPGQEVDVNPALRTALQRAGLSASRSDEMVGMRKASRAWLEGAIFETARADRDVLRGAMDKAGLAPAPLPTDASIVAAAREHYWVQIERAGSWENLDASGADAKPGITACTPSETYAELPATVFQTITISVRNDYVGDSKAITSETVLTHQLKVSDVSGAVLFLDNIVVGGEGGGLLGSGRTDRYRPMLRVGDTAITGSDFFLLPPGSGGIFGDALAGGSAGPLLVAQWIDFRFGAPGRQGSESRAVVDLIDPVQRATGKVVTMPDPAVVAAALAQGGAIAVSAGRIHPAVAFEAAYGTLDPQAAGRSYEAADKPPTEASQNDAAETDQPLLGALALAHAVASERALVQLSTIVGPHVRLIRDQPFVCITNVAVRARNDGKGLVAELSVDLRNNAVRVIADSPSHALDAFWANVLHGLVDGAIERHLPESAARPPQAPPPSRFDASSALQLARSQGIELRASTGSAAAQLLRGDLGRAGGARLAREVGDGVAILTPVRPLVLQDEPRLGLWAVNLQTGHVLALLDNGLRGAQSAAERKLVELTRLLGQCLANTAIPMGACRVVHAMWRHQARIVLRDTLVPGSESVLVRFGMLL